jgi:hypothetical protein
MSKGAMGVVVGAVLIAAALVVAGCGGGSSTGSDNGAALTKAQFVKQANAVCKKGQQEREAGVNELAEEVKPGADPGELPKKGLVEAIIGPLHNMVENLAALPAPEGDEEQVEEIVEAYRKPVEEIEEDENVAFNGALFEEASEKALKYGLEDCAL